GYPIARATTADGQWAYTIYRRENGTAFVHELNLIDAYAWCVDLPGDIRAKSAHESDAWQIAVESGGVGNDGYVANGSLGFLARITDSGEVAASSKLDPGSVLALVAGSGSGAYVLGSSGLSLLDQALQPVVQVAQPAAGSLVLSPAGWVYVLTPEGQLKAI